MGTFRRVSSMAVAVLAVGALAFGSAAQTVTGTVKAVATNGVVLVTGDGTEYTFEVSPATRVLAAGAAHRSQALSASGKKATLGQFVREKQHVTVYYQEQDGSRTVQALHVH